MRLISAGSPPCSFSAPQPIASSCRRATKTSPRGSASSSASAEMLRPGSNPASNRASSSAKYDSKQCRTAALVGSSIVISTSPDVRSRSTTPIASTRRVRCSSSSGSSNDHASSSLRRSRSFHSIRPALLSCAMRARPSSGLCSTTISPSLSSLRKSRLRYPESRSSRARSDRTSRPSSPISHKTRDVPSGRLRARYSSLRAPIRCVTVRLKPRTRCVATGSII